MELDSESSCTYKDYVTAYSSTKDSELWNTLYAVGTQVNHSLSIEKVPVMLSDETSPEDTHEIPNIGPTKMEEMMMEPLFSVPKEHESIIQSIAPYKKGSLLVSASTYGLKCLIFSLHGCIMCTRSTNTTIGAHVYIPCRFFKKITMDCTAQGVDCELYDSSSGRLYHDIELNNIPEVCKGPFEASQEQIILNTKARDVTRSLTPVFADKFKFYYPVDLTLFVVLDPKDKIKLYDEVGNLVVYRTKREIKIIPLCIEQSVSHGNDVALKTSPV